MDLVHWENLEGAGGEEGGRGDRDGGKKKECQIYDAINFLLSLKIGNDWDNEISK